MSGAARALAGSGALLVLAGVALAPGAGAEPVTASVDAACYASGRPITVSGSGFVPNAPLAIGGGSAAVAAAADANGTLAPTALTAPRVIRLAPTTVTLTIRDLQDASTAAQLSVSVVPELYASNAPISGTPTQRTLWRFAGFVPGQPIYGHFRRRGLTLRNYRFGMAAGACGTLTVRARRVPVTRATAGYWVLKLDQRPRYARNTPGRLITFWISR